MSTLPRNNPFLHITPEIRKSAEANLHQAIAQQVRLLSYQADGEEWFITTLLGNIQKHLKTLQEYGFTEVQLLDESKFPALVEAIGPLKRAGISDEVIRIMTNLLTTCGIPEAVITKK